MEFPDKLHSRYFKGYKFEPATVIDVGVLDGTPWLYKSFPNAKFVLIDVLRESQDSVAQKWGDRIDYDFHVTGVGAKKASMEMDVLPQGLARSGLNARLDGHAVDVERREVPVVQLDSITQNYGGPFGLKIDTEGFEIEVLKGAKQTLKKCDFVITEASIKNRFKNGYRFSEIIAFMAAEGFEVYSFLSGLTRAPRMADVLFIPADSPRFDLPAKDQ